MNDDLRQLQEELYRMSGDHDSHDSQESETVAIPKGVLEESSERCPSRH